MPTRPPRWLLAWAAPTLLLLTALTWALASPVGSAPDDDKHVANIYCIHEASDCRSDDITWPSDVPWWYGEPQMRRGAEWADAKRAYKDLWRYTEPRILPCYVLNGTNWYSPDSTAPATCLDEENPQDNHPASVDRLENYPSLYYRFLSPFTGQSIRESVVTWRVLNVLIATAMFTGAVLLSARRYRRPVAVGALVASMPVGLFLMSSVNPSSWLLIGSASFLGPAVTALREHGAARLSAARVAYLLVCLLLIVGGRSEGIAHAAVLVLVALILGLRVPRFVYGLVAIFGALVGAFAVVLASRLSDVTKTLSWLDSARDGLSAEGKLDALAATPGLFFSGDAYRLGWLEVVPPATAVVATQAAFWSTAALGLAVMFRRKAVALAVVGCVLLLVPAAVLASGNPNPLTRYTLPLVFMLAFVFLVPRPDRWLPRWSRAQWVFLGAALSIANSLCLLYLTVRYVSGLSPGTTNPRVLAATPTPDWWWGVWLSPFANWLLGTVVFAALVVVLFSLPSIRESDEDHPPEMQPVHPEDPYHDFWNPPEDASDLVGEK